MGNHNQVRDLRFASSGWRLCQVLSPLLLLACTQTDYESRARAGNYPQPTAPTSPGAPSNTTGTSSAPSKAGTGSSQGGRPQTGSGTGRAPAPTGECPDPNHVPGTEGCLTAAAFDPDVVREFELDIDDADLERMIELASDDETEKTYVPAQLTVDGEDVGMVGVRYKGAFGTLETCINADTGELECDKMSYKIKFDEFDEELRWNKLKKVNVHSMRVDKTLMHEQLAYSVFRDMGIAAPRSAHAQVTVNGERKGVFALTEAPDGRFTADRFAPMGDGNLYKEVWPQETDTEYFQDGLETNADEPQDHAPFLAFSRALLAAEPADLPAVLREYVDIDYMLRYLAVDGLIANWDGITSFYCWSEDPQNSCRNHNYYWYVNEPGDRFWLVPWDLDHTWSPSTEQEVLLPSWRERPNDCDTRRTWRDSLLMPPGCDPLLHGLGRLGRGAYRAALGEVLDGPFQVDKLHAKVDHIVDLISPYVEDDPTMDFETWQSDIEDLKSDIETLRMKGEQQLDGATTSTARSTGQD